MFHDVAILLGLFAWLGKPLDGMFLAALLTVIGYSVNDSVVVFDRIRDRLRPGPGGRDPGRHLLLGVRRHPAAGRLRATLRPDTIHRPPDRSPRVRLTDPPGMA
jgi:hypothetical protein